jgi:Gpi18-like mannosyltransferase
VPTRSRLVGIATDVRARAVIPPFVVSRLVVLLSLVLTRHVLRAGRVHRALPLQARLGLVGWDASWYRDIAHAGYGSVSKAGLRFFPLFPAIARAVSWLPGVSASLAVVLVANVFALAAGFLLYELVMREGKGVALARRSVWILFLAPSAFVLVMGYAEALFLVAALVALLALRHDRWWVAAAAGVVAGLTRPLGVLLVVPALFEVYRARRSASGTRLLAMAGAVISPAVGAGAYLVWAEHRTHDLLYPLTIQQQSTSRGGWIDPVRAIWRAAHQFGTGDHLSSGIHIVTAALLVVLIVVLYQRWPASFTAYAIATALVILSAHNLDSLERYSFSTVPFVVAAADLTGGGTRERVVLSSLGALLVIGSVLAFSGVLVP